MRHFYRVNELGMKGNRKTNVSGRTDLPAPAPVPNSLTRSELEALKKAKEDVVKAGEVVTKPEQKADETT